MWRGGYRGECGEGDIEVSVESRKPSVERGVWKLQLRETKESKK